MDNTEIILSDINKKITRLIKGKSLLKARGFNESNYILLKLVQYANINLKTYNDIKQLIKKENKYPLFFYCPENHLILVTDDIDKIDIPALINLEVI